MKTFFLYAYLCLLFIGISTNSYAQKQFKFGDVPEEILKMTAYPTDTSAVAAVIYENCDLWYTTGSDDLRLNKNYTIRIKIFKNAGLDYADFSIPYIYGNNDSREHVTGITGYTYNIDENGKKERIKLTKEYIVEEKTSDSQRRKKIAFPNVKAGSVIELKYELSSPHYTHLDDYIFQADIPVRYSRYAVVIPEYFRFSKNTMGFEPIDYSESIENISFLFGGGHFSCSGYKMVFEVNELPAMKDDNYVWNKYDYMSRVNFDLKGIQFPYSPFRSLASNWQNIDQRLMEAEHFGKQLRFTGLLKNEIAEIKVSDKNDTEKITDILNLVKQKIQHNDKNDLFISDVRKSLKEGTGSSAEMNALLLCALKDAGYEPFPVVMSLRSRGRLLINQPSITNLNFYVVGVIADNKTIYMDASEKYGSLNVLHTDCMVQNARMIQNNKPSKWVDLQNTGRNVTTTHVTAKFNEDGILSGKFSANKIGVPAMNACHKYDKEKDLDEYQKKLESELDIKISDFKVDGFIETPNIVKESYTFENTNINLGDEYLYINPLLFPIVEENEFKAESRKLPIEFSYPYTFSQRIFFEIPENYEVDELPKAERINLNDGDITYAYLIKLEGNTLQINHSLTIKRTLYGVNDYEHLREFWATVATKNTAQMVLKLKAD